MALENSKRIPQSFELGNLLILKLSPLIKGEGAGVLSAKGDTLMRLRAVGVRSYREEIGVPFNNHTRFHCYDEDNHSYNILVNSTVPYFF